MKRYAKALITTLGLSGLIVAAASLPAVAQKKYDKGVTDTEIKIGNIMPYSGPASAYGIIGKTMIAYMKMVNDMAASTAARSTSFPTTTPTARPKPWSRRAS